LANALLLTRRRDIELAWVTSRARITALGAGASASYSLEEGPLVSIIPVGDQANCTSSGLRWPLGGQALTAGSTRGVSNEIIDSPATISVISWDVLIVHERNHDV
jgi:thiamine pyrophosphokinase